MADQRCNWNTGLKKRNTSNNIIDKIFYCPTCKCCWEIINCRKTVYYEAGNLPTFGKPKIECSKCIK